MTAYQAQIRNGIYSAINLAKAGLVISDFDLEYTYYPTSRLEDIGTKPQVKVTAMGMASNRDRMLRNAGVKVLELGVMVHVQQRMDPTATLDLDDLVELVEELMDLCEDDELVAGADYQWARTEPLRDENDIIYSYEALTVNGVFQAVFTVHYTYILQGV